jgi:hypothetical protein
VKGDPLHCHVRQDRAFSVAMSRSTTITTKATRSLRSVSPPPSTPSRPVTTSPSAALASCLPSSEPTARH